MENTIIQKHNFEIAKEKIQKLSNNLPSTVSFQQFPTDGNIFSWNEHNITGEEANTKLVSPLQSTLIAQNNNIKSLFSIVNEVYKAFDFLDKEYIQGIISAVKAAEIASNQAKEASLKSETASGHAMEATKKALDASSKASSAQTDIKKTIEALTITVSSLKKFKDEVSKELNVLSSLSSQVGSAQKKILYIEQNNESFSSQIVSTRNTLQNFGKRVDELYRDFATIQEQSKLLKNQKHFGDIDSIWNDVNKHKSVIDGIVGSLESLMKRVNDSDKNMHELISNITVKLESYSHLDDIDTIWKDVERHKTSLSELHTEMNAFAEKVNPEIERMNNDITVLQNYRTLLESYTHLSDIDTIWNDVKGLQTHLLKCHEQLDNFIPETYELINTINKTIDNVKEQEIKRNLLVDKKIKIAYGIAACSITISVVQFILQLAGVL